MRYIGTEGSEYKDTRAMELVMCISEHSMASEQD